MFPTIKLSKRFKPIAIEEIGTKPKFWFRGTRATEPFFGKNKKLLFKSDSRGTGEDWAEKVSCELCELLGLPHVHYELAFDSRWGAHGVICPTCAPGSNSLILGNQLLFVVNPSYPMNSRKYNEKNHTIEAVAVVLNAVYPPTESWMKNVPEAVRSALDVFAGYILLDAWVANQDRHHENWGVLLQDGKLHLAPTFDHGAALARNISDKERQERMTTKDVGRNIFTYSRKAMSAFYSKSSPEKVLSTYDAWRQFSAYAPTASAAWMERLQAIGEDEITRILNNVPDERLSAIGKEFSRRLLWENRVRILNGEDK